MGQYEDQIAQATADYVAARAAALPAYLTALGAANDDLSAQITAEYTRFITEQNKVAHVNRLEAIRDGWKAACRIAADHFKTAVEPARLRLELVTLVRIKPATLDKTWKNDPQNG